MLDHRSQKRSVPACTSHGMLGVGSFPYGAIVYEVEVDPATGVVEIVTL